MTVSAVRALFSVANRPEVVSLAGGMPNIADLPLADLGASFDQLIQTKGVQAMQYGSGQGEEQPRATVAADDRGDVGGRHGRGGVGDSVVEHGHHGISTL